MASGAKLGFSIYKEEKKEKLEGTQSYKLWDFST